jgi:hypothetical protein
MYRRRIKENGCVNKLTFRRLEKRRWLYFRISFYDILQDINQLLAIYDLLELRRHVGLRSKFLLTHPSQFNGQSKRNCLQECIKEELKEIDLSMNDLDNLRDISDLLLEFRNPHKKIMDANLRKAFRVYKGGKLKLPKQVQVSQKGLHHKDGIKSNKRSVMRQELYGEVSDKELLMIVDTLMEFESPNSFCPGDSESE